METLKLTRTDSKPWGFRISGGKDFGVVLSIQRVNPGSLAAEKGLRSGDALLAINGKDTTDLRHKEAQDAILQAGNDLEITIQRGGSTSFKPAGAQKSAPAGGDTVTAILHQQYNSPVDMYSMNTIADTLTAHAEMIAPGVMGINFMKPEHPVNTMSEVYRLVQEEEQNKAKSPTPPKGAVSPSGAPRRAAPPIKTPPPVAPKPVVSAPMMNSHSAPAPAPAPLHSLKKTAPPPAHSHGTCSDCGRYITSTFARVGDRILHEDCFRCSTCGTSLQNIGYSNLNNKLYCEIHAKLAARVIAAEMESTPSPLPFELPRSIPQAPQSQFNQFNVAPLPTTPMMPQPLPTTPAMSQPLPTTPAMPQPLPMPPSLSASDTTSIPTPYVPPSQQLTNFPLTPSSSGGLTFRSISPQPFKRISGDYHRVTAPTSPTPGSAPPMPSYESTGPLPFESKPYMPPGQALSSYQSSTQVSQTTQMSQMSQSFQQTTVSQQQSSQYQMDYKQIVGQQKGTKFVWPPPKPEEMLNEKRTDSSAAAPPPMQQNYSPLATQSSPPESHPPTSFSTSQQAPAPALEPTLPEAPASQPKPPLSTYVPPPLPSTFSKPQEQEKAPAPSAPEPCKETCAPAPPAPAVGLAPGFAPVLAPVVDTESKKDGLGGVPQSGVPTGAGSRPAPRRGKGQVKEQLPGCRIPICSDCGSPIRGPFVIALGKTWCPDHFICNNLHCKRALQDVGFVEEQGQLYCENCYEAFLAPICNKCNVRIKGDCLNALDKPWHPECFLCAYCHKPFGNSSFYLEDGLPYCEKDWNELFTTKCVGCGFPIEAGDRWVEALNNNYHSQCFKCSICSKNLEGQSFFAKGGRPFCKAHAR